MAGIRHHILPRFLLKGFASRHDKDESFVWVYRSNSKPFETNIVNSGVEKYFYGKDGEVDADDEITKIEGGYAYLINTLRNTTNEIEDCNPQIAEFVAHLSLRTKNIRNSLLKSSNLFAEKIAQWFSDISNIKRLINTFRPVFVEVIIKHFPNISPEHQNLMAENLIQLMLQNTESKMEEIISDQFEFLTESKINLPQMVKEKHNQLMIDNTVPDEKVEVYNKLNWFVCTSKETLILGDTGCLFETGGQRRFKPYDYTDDFIANIFLPISSNKIVIGTRYSKVQQLDVKTINKAFAKCASEFFVSSELSPDKISLSSTIGDWFGVITDSEIECLFKNLFQEMLKETNL